MDSDKLILTFIEAVQRRGGTISPRTSPSMAGDLETPLSFGLPYLYRKLIDAYEFFPFEIGSIEFFGSFGGKDDPDDISSIEKDFSQGSK